MPLPQDSERVVIVGAGHAAGEFAGSLRSGGYAGRIILIGEEPHLPYQRPPLSKAFLSGELGLPELEIKPESSYRSISVEIRAGVRVERIDRRAKQLFLGDGTVEHYTKLVLATGGRPRSLPLPGTEAPERLSNLHYLRNAYDASRLRAQLKPGFRLVIVGGGYIGLEVAAVARKHGLQVTVLETQARVLARVTAPELSTFYESVHRAAGVDILTNTTVRSVQVDSSGDAIASLTTHDGTVIMADVVLAGIGLIPNVEIAQAAGLAVENGIVVDEFTQTADPDILAVGDCSNHPSRLYGRCVRIESVPNAVGQARAAAATLCGKPQAYDGVPWFWSDQYDLKLQIAGLSQGYDGVVLRGSPESRCFTVFYLKDERIIAADAVNRPKDFMLAKRLVAARTALTSSAALADDARPLQSFLNG
jgi:3-phenylpropionate/trans-cinnamate dioxygenase ferredoxin reductase subunit